jgi:RNA 2',3'-cyclic 3'-phosphodiesterase
VARDRAPRPEAPPLRLFVAIEIPQGAKDAVAEAFEPLRAEYPKARWAPQENWHVTVKFLGATYPRLLEWVVARLGAVAADAAVLRTRVSGIGCFPAPGRARVLWAGLDDGPGRITELALGVDAALSKEFKPETRPFSAHLTVARSDPPLRLPETFAETALATEMFTVGELVLFRSHLQRPAPRYEAVSRFPFGR